MMVLKSARIRVPASTSNLGAAFDAVGLALNLYLQVEVAALSVGESHLEYAGCDAQLIPSGPSNLIWKTMLEVADDHNAALPPFRMRVANDIPIAKGLGSSASACLAAAAAADFLADLKLSREDYLQIAVAREGHPDNVAAALYGGLVASISAERILCSKADFPVSWKIVAVTPDYELETKRARKVLPKWVPHGDAVFNVQRAAFLMAQLLRGRTEGVREAMKDMLHQPYRSHLLPGLEDILALDGCAGLIGIALSGAGSTVIAFVEANAQEIGARISEIFSRHHLGVQVRLLQADNEGLRIEQSGFNHAE